MRVENTSVKPRPLTVQNTQLSAPVFELSAPVFELPAPVFELPSYSASISAPAFKPVVSSALDFHDYDSHDFYDCDSDSEINVVPIASAPEQKNNIDKEQKYVDEDNVILILMEHQRKNDGIHILLFHDKKTNTYGLCHGNNYENSAKEVFKRTAHLIGIGHQLSNNSYLFEKTRINPCHLLNPFDRDFLSERFAENIGILESNRIFHDRIDNANFVEVHIDNFLKFDDVSIRDITNTEITVNDHDMTIIREFILDHYSNIQQQKIQQQKLSFLQFNNSYKYINDKNIDIEKDCLFQDCCIFTSE